MPKLSRSRKSKLIRNADGTFRRWIGGSTNYSHHGLVVHIGKEFKKQRKRKAKTGDIVRKKKLDGQFHKGALWYVKTPHGWRKSPTEKRKPTEPQIRKIIEASRVGRARTPRRV